jgi:hypothetical protein
VGQSFHAAPPRPHRSPAQRPVRPADDRGRPHPPLHAQPRRHGGDRPTPWSPQPSRLRAPALRPAPSRPAHPTRRAGAAGGGAVSGRAARCRRRRARRLCGPCADAVRPARRPARRLRVPQLQPAGSSGTVELAAADRPDDGQRHDGGGGADGGTAPPGRCRSRRQRPGAHGGDGAAARGTPCRGPTDPQPVGIAASRPGRPAGDPSRPSRQQSGLGPTVTRGSRTSLPGPPDRSVAAPSTDRDRPPPSWRPSIPTGSRNSPAKGRG